MLTKFLAMTTLYTVWGSTYLAVHFALDCFPPLMMSAVRFVLAGALLYTLRRGPRPSGKEWRSAALVGLLLMGLGTGGVAFAAETISSGQCALLVALVPVWMTLWEALKPGGRFPGWMVVLGLLLGTSGVATLALGANASPQAGLANLVVIAGTLAWAAGSLASRSLPQPADSIQFSAMNMIWGGIWLALMAALRGESWDGDFTPNAALAWIYLVVVGSIVGLSVYTWLLRNVQPGLVATYTYVNPLVAVLLSLAVGEALPKQLPQAMLLIVSGVALISLGSHGQVLYQWLSRNPSLRRARFN